MKIASIDIADSSPNEDRVSVATVRTEDGVAGVSPVSSHAAATMRLLFDQRLKGRDPRATMALYGELCDADCDDTEANAAAIASLDIAMWDIKARLSGEPLWKTLGASMPGVIVHVSDDGAIADESAFATWLADRCELAGIAAASVQIGDDGERNLARVNAAATVLRRATSHPVLYVVPRPGWSATQTIEHVQRLERSLDIAAVLWNGDDARPADSRMISDNVFAAVCGGQCLRRVTAYRPWFEAQALDVVEIDLRRTGISGALQIAEAAFGLELPVMLCSDPPSLGVHLAPALPNFMSLELAGVPNTAKIDSDIQFRDGRAFASASAGNGLRLVREGSS